MNEDAVPDDAPEVVVRRRRRWPRRIASAIVLLVFAIGALLLLLDTGPGHRLIANRIAALHPADGMRYRIGRIEGSIYGRARLVDVRIYDPKGLVLRAPVANLDWNPFAWVSNRLDITRLVIPRAVLSKLPQPRPTGRKGPILPGFDIRIGALRVDRLEIAPTVTGVARVGKLQGRADIRAGRALVDLAARVDGSDLLRIHLDAEPDRDRFDVAARAIGRSDGVLARLSGIRRPLSLRVAGDGTWSNWQGSALGIAGDTRVIDLNLGNRAGTYTLGGTLAPSSLLKGKLQRLSAPRILVSGGATLANRRLEGRLGLRSAALAVEAEGALDLAQSAYRDVRIRARLLRPAALFGNMSGRNIELRAILEGPFATAAFDYRLTADRLAFDNTGFEGARASGKGRLSKAPVDVPIRVTAQRVTGVGDVAGGILRNLSVDGVLKVTSTTLTGSNLRLRSDKLNGTIMLVLDLRTGRYEVGLNGGLRRYLIPGLGVVDVQSQLTAVPGPNGRGTRIVGRGAAQMVRLDNGFFRSLTEGLPRITTGLERGTDGVLYFRNLVLTSPGLTLSGNGFRRRDGTFRFIGQGRQRTYGPVTLVLDGRIEKPTLDLQFQRPNDTLGLADVTAHLDPVAEGYAFTAEGESRLGPFTGAGRILLPRGQDASIAVDRLDVSGTRASGAIAIVEGGFDGRLAFGGGGLSGEVRFVPQGDIQRIDITADARNAQLGEQGRVRSGRLEASVLLDPEGTAIDATLSAQGVRRGALSIGRVAANAKLRGGEGEVRASIAGSQGRAFNIQSITQVTADEYRVQAQGTLDGRPLKLETPAVIRHEEDGGWRIAPTRFTFAGGEAEASGRFGAGETEVALQLTRMPLSVLDIGYPGLGLSGNASGKLDYTLRDGIPSGRVNMTVRGLSRAGLVLDSRPIDIGVAAVLDSGKVGARALLASGGKIIGRAQARLAPLGSGGTLASRIANAPLVGQLRYDGPADTLWRMTGIELFDLSGPLAIGADVSGRLADPQIRGLLRATNARIESAATGTVLTQVNAQGRFGGSRLVIDQFSASDGRSGQVSGTGAFDLAAVRGFGIDLTLNAKSARLINTDTLAATVTGPITFRSDGSGGVIGGEVRINEGRYQLGKASSSTPLPRINVREINLPGGDEIEEAPRRPWRMNIHARATKGLVVTGLGLRSEWSADLDIRGEPTNPSIRGRADLVQGDVEFAGREFELKRGVIQFDGSVPANPALDISADGDAEGLNATIRVTGTAEKPEIDFTSTPALPQDELLSRLLFGTSITNLSAPEALQLASAVAALQDGDSGLDPINAVRRATGLDRLRILPADPQTGQGTSVAAGKYLTRRLYAEIVTDGQGYSATNVEFRVTRWLSLLASVSTIGRQSANLRASRDY
ncbi:translocation/assembly module TamB domain-containing protein [Sphingomonas sp. 3-13AW]|uniref:translocation/assembly module TamB domain-containing protein n=1 Tax=Sphingomonas sp. 3-13AW TaxID=3050450 RepID=UPI003BB6D556